MSATAGGAQYEGGPDWGDFHRLREQVEAVSRPMRLSFVGRDGALIREFLITPGAELLIDDGIERWLPSVYRVWLRR